MSVISQISKLVFQHKAQLIAGILAMFCFSLLTVAPAWYVKDIVDSLSSGKVWPLENFILIGLAVILLFTLKGISYYGQNSLMGSLGQKIVRDLRDRLFKKVIRMPIIFYNKRSTGELVSRFTIDASTLNQAVITGIIAPLRDIPQIFFLLGILVYRSWQLSLLALLVLPPAAWAISKFGQQSKKVTTKRLNKFGDLTSLLNETITGIRVVKAFSMEEYEIDRFQKENQSLFRSFLHSIRIGSYSYPALEQIGSICGAAMLSYGGYLLIHDQITGGDFASFILSFFMMNEPIKKLNNITLKLQEGHAAAIRIFEILNSDLEIKNSPDATALPPIKEGIRIKVDRFRYEDEDEPVLRDIDINLAAGSITALVGASGSGKTTLSNLIPRFYEIPPEDGGIWIDGHDLRQTTLDSLRSQIAIVTQDIVLFNDTVASNISYGNINCSRDKIVEAATIGYAHAFISAMPDGYDQIVGEKGVRLSGGQRQRVAISRALIKDAPILILDEATSALDTESEKEVQAAIENLMKNRTTLVIAHRLSTVQHADVIHVMKDGNIVESGSHKDLLEQGGEYRKLYDMQFQEPGSMLPTEN
ncbi:MAG: ATP-binding cassette domain-containing protein [Proteobacteria bacterium]|nr:ATP-binding cassette domain-containing protein [Pseudomonadota bacterium]